MEDRDDAKRAVRTTADRVFCRAPDDADRRSKGGILIPATAATRDRHGVWLEVTEVGPQVRTIEPGDKVLVLPEAMIEVDVRGEEFVVIREREVHAIASPEREAGSTGLYL